MEWLFKSPWFANFYAEEIKTCHANLEREPEMPFVITVVSQADASALHE